MSISFRRDRLAKLRKQNGTSGEELGKRSGLTQGFISALERGAKTPSIETLAILARTLGTTVGYLLGETDDPEGDTIATEFDQPSIPAAAVEPPTESGIVFDYEDKDKKIHLTFAKDTPVEVMQTIIREAMQLPPGEAHKPTGTLPHAIGGDVVG